MKHAFVLCTAAALLAGCGRDPAGTDPGRPVVRRLTRTEYNNTVRDLFGTAQRPGDTFPADDFGLGFDNIGEVLSISPLHIEQYDRAADLLVDELFAFGTLPPTSRTWEAEGGELTAENGTVWDVTNWVLWTEGQIAATLWVEAGGEYQLRVDAAGQQAGDEPVRMALRVDGVDIQTFDVPNDAVAGFDATVQLSPGRREIGVAFLNDFKAPPDADRNLLVDRISATGPIGVPRQPYPLKGMVVDCDPAEIGEAACAEHIARTFGRRVFRRPLTEDEVAERMAAYAAVVALDGGWDESIRALVKSLLLAPQFIYRAEPDAVSGPRELNGYELASRLSYFLWSSTPDDRLLDLAQTGQLVDPDVLVAEARRMLADWRSEALVTNLAAQWLGIRKVDEAHPNSELFPEFDDELRASMRTEMELFIGSVLRDDRPLTDLLTTTDTFVNARLAAFYGVPAPEGDAFVLANVPGRAGLLGRSGLLAGLSYPTRTSPVIRGNWVLTNLMCDAPLPPPGMIPAFPEAPEEPTSLREVLEQHAQPGTVCYGCHKEMDAVGIALEEYGPIGQIRTIDDFGGVVDTTGTLEGLGAFADATELQALLATDPRFGRCMMDKLFTFGIGREPTDDDHMVIDTIAVQVATDGFRFDDLVAGLVQTRAFRWRNGDAP
jgi:Protein of unknown function (DUF1592)/Protein of unknown function (DUF1588)/Protein of unknown function (DUF1587)/Ca-dependent carbohydrate-binding module xylan-binding/Protein of unknown function (DUF1585)/Protein of unknown function (DUF1595)